MTISEAIDIFFISRKARNLSKNTIKWYKLSLDKLIVYCEKNNLKNIEEVKTHHIEDLLNHQRERVRDITVKDFFNTFRVFFTYLFDEEYINRNPMKNMKAPKVQQKIMRTFTPEEINKILKSFDTSSFLGLRNYLIMCMFFSTGMRKGELLDLKMHDVNITLDTIKVTGKGNKQRMIPIGRTLRRVLIRYLNEREDYIEDNLCDYLIISYTKRQFTAGGVNRVFKTLKTELGISGERFSSHSWRHTFAKTALLNGMDLFSLQRIMGHNSLNTTKKYIALNDKEIKAQHAKFNPLDNSDWSY